MPVRRVNRTVFFRFQANFRRYNWVATTERLKYKTDHRLPGN